MVVQFETQRGGIVQFSQNPLDVFNRFRQLTDDSDEAGGILIGRMLLDGDVVIDRVTSPSKVDKTTRFSFFRPIRIAQQFVVNIWRSSHGTQNYLGEWHTHPEDIPHPSRTDIVNWKRIWRKSKVETNELFFVIVGRKTISVWSLKEENQEPSPLKMIDT